MNDPAPDVLEVSVLEVSLGDDETFGRIHIELAAYCDFDAWMDAQTQLLSQYWLHLAAPAAGRIRRQLLPALGSGGSKFK